MSNFFTLGFAFVLVLISAFMALIYGRPVLAIIVIVFSLVSIASYFWGDVP